MHWLLGAKLWVNSRYAEAYSVGHSGVAYAGIDRVKLSIHPLLPCRSDNHSTNSAKHSSAQRVACNRPLRSAPPKVADLRCERCRGPRSISYHHGHSRDPVAFPAVGICSRRKTKCAAVKAKLKVLESLPVIHELAADEMVHEKVFPKSTLSKFDSKAKINITSCQSLPPKWAADGSRQPEMNFRGQL